jgi:hypothetical protein
MYCRYKSAYMYLVVLLSHCIHLWDYRFPLHFLIFKKNMDERKNCEINPWDGVNLLEHLVSSRTGRDEVPWYFGR